MQQTRLRIPLLTADDCIHGHLFWPRATIFPTQLAIGRLLTKLDARDRTHLVIAAYEAGLVDRWAPEATGGPRLTFADTAQLVGQPALVGRLSTRFSRCSRPHQEMAAHPGTQRGYQKRLPRRCGIHSQMAQCPVSNA